MSKDELLAELRELVVPDVMTIEEASQHCRLSAGYLNELRYAGKGPAFLQLGRAVRYRREALDAWLRSQERQP